MARMLSTFTLAAILLFSGTLFAQTITGVLTGTVIDQSDAVMPGVTVELTGEAQIGGAQVAITDGEGRFRFASLAPGAYEMTATLAGFKTVILEGVQVQVGRTFDVGITLELGSLEETITVTGESPLVDVASTAVTTNYSQEMVKNLPVTRFSVFDLFQMVPGVASSQVQESTRSSAFGSNTNENQYQIDGTDITSPTSGGMWPYPNTDVVEELEFIGVGAPAEYGNMQGAVFNVVTKSGANDVNLLSNWYSQYQSLTGSNTPDEEFSFYRDNFNDATVQIGGPFAQDKLWWFASYQYKKDFRAEPGTDPAFPTQDRQDRVFGKLNWQITPTQRLMVAYHDDIWRLPSTITPTNPVEVARRSNGFNPTPTAVWNMLINDRTTLEARYGGFYNWSKSRGVTSDFTTPGVTDIITGQNSVNIRNVSVNDLSPTSTNASVKLSRFFVAGSQEHDLRVGFQLREGTRMRESFWPGGMRINQANGEPDNIDVRDPSFNGGHIRTLGFYVDDGWQVSRRVKLNLGLRVDRNRGWIQDMPQLDSQRNEVGTVEGIDDLIGWDSVSPRAGVVIQLSQDGGTVLRASYGRYSQGITLSDFEALSPAQAVERRFGWNPATSEYDILQRVRDVRGQFTVDPDLKDPFTDQYTVGIDHEVAPSLAVGASYVYKRGDDFISRVDAGGTYEPFAFQDPQTGQALTLFNRVSPPEAFRSLLTNPEPGACSYCDQEFEQRYHGAILRLTKRMSDRWQAIASVTFGKVEGLHAGTARDTGSSQDSRARGFGEDPNDFINGFGLLNGDRNVLWKLQASYVLPGDVAMSTNWQWIAGKPFTRRLSVSGLNQGRTTIFLDPRDGSLRMAALNFVDVRFEKRFALGGSQRFTLMADVLNLGNIDTPLELISEIATSPNFGKGELVANPRRVMLGLRYEF